VTPILIIILFRRKNLKTSKTNGVPSTQAKLFTMKCYRFSRRRKNYLYGLSDYEKSRRKSDYMINTGRSKMLDSGFFENEVWGALYKAWKGYVIAKNKDEYDKMLHYADIVRATQICKYRRIKVIVITTKVMTGVIKNKYQKKKSTTNMNKKNSLMNIVKILEMITTKLINSLMIMHIVNILRMITIN
jgi:hypothetical protein